MLDETEPRSSKIRFGRAKFQVKGTFNPELKRKRNKLDKKKPKNNKQINYLIEMNVRKLSDTNMKELLL